MALAVSVAGSCVFGGVLPAVTDVVMKQASQTRVEVSYTLSDEAIVTLRVLTNGAPVEASALWGATGDVNRKIAAGAGRRIVWTIDELWPADVVTNVQAEVTAWRTDAPPLYCAVDLSSGSTSSSYPVSYYASEGDVPGGVTNDVWKLARMLFRRIDPTDGGGVQLGSQKGMIGYFGVSEAGVRAWITRPFYLAVYETTQRQWLNVMGGTNPSRDQADVDGRSGALRPVEQISYNSVRGGTPDTAPASSSFVDRMRTRTACATMDLPTEAQWEYGCRAGGTEQFPYRIPFTGTDERGDFIIYDYFNHNNELNLAIAQIGNSNASGAKHTLPVGSYPPNAFGLYDTVGNVWEWVLDRYVADRTALEPSAWIDSAGPTAAQADTTMVIKGGSHSEGLNQWKDNRFVNVQNKTASFARYPLAAKDKAYNLGFRMAIGLE